MNKLKISLAIAFISNIFCISLANAEDLTSEQIRVTGSIGIASSEEKYGVAGTTEKAKIKKFGVEGQVGFVNGRFEYGPELFLSNTKTTDSTGEEKIQFNIIKGFFDYNLIERTKDNKVIPFVGAGLGYGLAKLSVLGESFKGDGFSYDLHTGMRFFPVNDTIAFNFVAKYYKHDIKVDSNDIDFDSYDEDGLMFNAGLTVYFNI